VGEITLAAALALAAKQARQDNYTPRQRLRLRLRGVGGGGREGTALPWLGNGGHERGALAGGVDQRPPLTQRVGTHSRERARCWRVGLTTHHVGRRRSVVQALLAVLCEEWRRRNKMHTEQQTKIQMNANAPCCAQEHAPFRDFFVRLTPVKHSLKPARHPRS
jgi:hypothetical protein